MTIGLGTYRDSQETIILVTGDKKEPALTALLNGETSPENPVSSVNLDPNHRIMADWAATPRPIRTLLEKAGESMQKDWR